MGVDDVASAGWVSDKSPFFTTLELTQRLDLIFHLIENVEIIPLIRGAEGGGKSTLAMRVRQAAPANWSICLLEADSAISPERLLANISRYFGWIDQQTGGLEGLVNCFEIMRDEGQVPVLLIDDAQRLSATAMITLLRLFERQRSGEPLVSIVLFGDEHINLLLATP
ncbi:MAG: ATP-binding protein, partial [Chromatiales bacterium]